MMKKIINVLSLLMISVGFVLLAMPYFNLAERNHHSVQSVTEFRQQTLTLREQSSVVQESNQPSSVQENSSVGVTAQKNDYNELFRRMQEYNRNLYTNKQSELRDIFSYSSTESDFTHLGLKDNMVGCITIDKMGIELPLYIGSNTENMSMGATVMNQTSMPIGGKNTNCVIAAHRMGGFFGDIELLSKGDIIKIENLWGELHYKVEKIIVIDPYDTDKIKIMPNRDMITLLTCHPYWSNETRYIVYCERVQNTQSNPDIDTTSNPTADPTTFEPTETSADITPMSTALPDGISYTTSQDTINTEHIVRIGGMILSGLYIVVFIFLTVKQHIAKKKKTYC